MSLATVSSSSKRTAPPSLATTAAATSMSPTFDRTSVGAGATAAKDALVDGPRVGPDELPALRRALRTHDMEAFKAIVDITGPHAVVDPLTSWHDQRSDGSYFSVLASHNWTEAIHWIAAQGANPNVNTLASNPINQAILYKNTAALVALLHEGANPSAAALDKRFGGLPVEGCTLDDMQGKLRRESHLGWLDWQVLNRKILKGMGSQWGVRSAAACFALDFPRSGDAEYWRLFQRAQWKPTEHDKVFMQIAFFQAKARGFADIQDALIDMGLTPDLALAEKRLKTCMNSSQMN